MTHQGDPRCVCTDGREAERDVTEMCGGPVLCSWCDKPAIARYDNHGWTEPACAEHAAEWCQGLTVVVDYRN